MVVRDGRNPCRLRLPRTPENRSWGQLFCAGFQDSLNHCIRGRSRRCDLGRTVLLESPPILTRMEKSSRPIVVFTDGAAKGNPGPGGWAAIVVIPGGRVRELGGGSRHTTNNQME